MHTSFNALINNGTLATPNPLPFKGKVARATFAIGRARVGMGRVLHTINNPLNSQMSAILPIPLPTSPLKGEESCVHRLAPQGRGGQGRRFKGYSIAGTLKRAVRNISE